MLTSCLRELWGMPGYYMSAKKILILSSKKKNKIKTGTKGRGRIRKKCQDIYINCHPCVFTKAHALWAVTQRPLWSQASPWLSGEMSAEEKNMWRICEPCVSLAKSTWKETGERPPPCAFPPRLREGKEHRRLLKHIDDYCCCYCPGDDGNTQKVWAQHKYKPSWLLRASVTPATCVSVSVWEFNFVFLANGGLKAHSF